MPRFQRLRTPEGTTDVLDVGEVRIRNVWCGRSDAARATPGDPFHVDLSYRAPGIAVVLGRAAGSGAGRPTIEVTVPRRALPVADPIIERFTAMAPPAESVLFETMVQPLLTGMAGRLEELSQAATVELRTIWVSVITMLILSLDRQPSGSADTAATRRRTALRFIEDRLSDPDLDPDMVAAALGISRRSLYHAFAGGAGVAATIRRLRLERARKALLDPSRRSRPIAELAREVGLPSSAHFSRLFHTEFGESPRALRARTAI